MQIWPKIIWKMKIRKMEFLGTSTGMYMYWYVSSISVLEDGGIFSKVSKNKNLEIEKKRFWKIQQNLKNYRKTTKIRRVQIYKIEIRRLQIWKIKIRKMIFLGTSIQACQYLCSNVKVFLAWVVFNFYKLLYSICFFLLAKWKLSFRLLRPIKNGN